MYARTAEKRSLGALGRMGIVAGMHVAIAYVVATALVIKNDAPPEAMLGEVFDEPRPVIERPSTTPPDLEQVDIYIPRPVVPDYETETERAPPDAREIPTGDEIIKGGGSAEPVPMIEGVRLDPRRPLTQPAYPAPDIRAGNEGNADIEVYVLPNGRVGDARILRSTGHPRLDQAAIDEAKKSWRLIPATRDGVAFAQWHRLRVVFRLTKG